MTLLNLVSFLQMLKGILFDCCQQGTEEPLLSQTHQRGILVEAERRLPRTQENTVCGFFVSVACGTWIEVRVHTTDERKRADDQHRAIETRPYRRAPY